MPPGALQNPDSNQRNARVQRKIRQAIPLMKLPGFYFQMARFGAYTVRQTN
jgi:hypothetical protein